MGLDGLYENYETILENRAEEWLQFHFSIIELKKELKILSVNDGMKTEDIVDSLDRERAILVYHVKQELKQMQEDGSLFSEKETEELFNYELFEMIMDDVEDGDRIDPNDPGFGKFGNY